MDQHSPIVTAEIADVVASLRAEVAQLHAELPRRDLVVWTAGNVSARVPGRDLLVIKPSGVSYDELTPESMVVTDLGGQSRRRRRLPVLRHGRTCLCLQAHARGRRCGAHALDLRHGLGGPRRADPVRADHDGRRVRRRDPGRSVRADRRRLDRPGHRRDAARPSLAGGADAEPRTVHHRTIGQGRRQVRRAVRGGRPHRPHRRASSVPRSRSRRSDIDSLFDRYQNAYGQT